MESKIMAKQIVVKDSKLKDLKPNPKNPRTISEEKLNSLRKSIEEFGDLSCIIFNELDGMLYGAHQRIKVWGPNTKIVITNKYKKANKQGTIKEGYIEYEGEKFKYRAVRWEKPKAEAAMLAANKHSGEWDQNKLSEIVESLKDLDFHFELTGFDYSDFPNIFDIKEQSKKREVSFVIDEKNKYLLLIELENEKRQQTLFEKLKNEGYECKIIE